MMFCVSEAIRNTEDIEDKIPPRQLILYLKYLKLL